MTPSLEHSRGIREVVTFAELYAAKDDATFLEMSLECSIEASALGLESASLPFLKCFEAGLTAWIWRVFVRQKNVWNQLEVNIMENRRLW